MSDNLDSTELRQDVNGAKEKRTRRTLLFPASSFEEALIIPNAIQKYASGMKVRRLTLFEMMGKSPDSGTSRQLCTNAHKYGLTKGGYSAEFLELTPDGKLASGTDVPPSEKLKARFRLAIDQIPPFKLMYETQIGNRVPDAAVLEDFIKESGVPEADARECVETFIVNAKFVGILRVIAGAERMIPLDQALEELPAVGPQEKVTKVNSTSLPAIEIISSEKVIATATTTGDSIWDTICFYITPIGEENSEQRKHSDLFLGALVEPALQEFNLKVVRADKIGKPGMITKQIIEYILRSKLVIADLSYHNPNVFYELSLRHVCRLPTVQIIRRADKIPFDLENFRTIPIDTTDIYTLVPNLQSYKAEIATQVRMVLKDPDSIDNPLGIYYPSLKASF